MFQMTGAAVLKYYYCSTAIHSGSFKQQEWFVVHGEEQLL